MQRCVSLDRPLDLPAVMGPVRRGAHDLCCRISNAEAVWASNTPDGAGTLHILKTASNKADVEAHGSGAGWLLDRSPALLGADDACEGFAPMGDLADIHRQTPGLRFCRTERLVEALVPTILEQKVQSVMAYRSYRGIVKAWGDRAPGPFDLYVPPPPQRLAEQPYYAFHKFEVERKRADTIKRVCADADRLERCATTTTANASKTLQSVPGLGAWSAAEVAHVALGDSDAVSVGDFHFKNWVSWNLAGEPRGDDNRMLELLQPYSGHRARVVRLLMTGGTRPPRFGPRLPLHPVAHI